MRMFLSFILLCSCSAIDEFADKRLPIRDVANITHSVVEVLNGADLNGDGAIQGRGEWYMFADLLIRKIGELSQNGS